MKKDKETRILEFDPVVYPFRLWVGKNVPHKSVEETFWALTTDMDKTPFDEVYYTRDRFVCATCYPVCDKESGWIGIFCNIQYTKLLTVGRMAHEATHIVDFLCEKLGIECYTFTQGEPRAYLVEWATNCIDKVKRGVV